MIEVRKSGERGTADYGWLRTYHSFSFGNYYDPDNVQFGPLRVLNEDFIKGGTGFDTHPHQNMEIVTYVLAGTLEHKDSTGGEGLIKAGELQRMSAGSGIYHSEKNASETEDVHLMQIWFIPEKEGIEPGYEQKEVSKGNDFFNSVVTKGGGKDKLDINQDITVYVGDLSTGDSGSIEIPDGRLGYLHNSMIGTIKVNESKLEPGDGLKITGPETLEINAESDSRLILFDMAP
ncbi:MAG: pirin family protein [Candidatus Marinimicrobia bacterium]|nr:pirin family protein [Candidatus Neomarinimicrobiota bacterium]MCH7954779.1 pirin family protein [Candidatus Neomarinimicrobiota bacterium]